MRSCKKKQRQNIMETYLKDKLIVKIQFRCAPKMKIKGLKHSSLNLRKT